MVFLITAFSSICTLCGVYDSWCIHAFHGGHLRTLGSRGLGKLQAGVKIHNFWMCVLYGWPRVSRTHLTIMIDYGAGWVFYLNVLHLFITWCCFWIDYFWAYVLYECPLLVCMTTHDVSMMLDSDIPYIVGQPSRYARGFWKKNWDSKSTIFEQKYFMDGPSCQRSVWLKWCMYCVLASMMQDGFLFEQWC